MVQSVRWHGNNLSLFNLYAAIVVGIVLGALTLNTKTNVGLKNKLDTAFVGGSITVQEVDRTVRLLGLPFRDTAYLGPSHGTRPPLKT